MEYIQQIERNVRFLKNQPEGKLAKRFEIEKYFNDNCHCRLLKQYDKWSASITFGMDYFELGDTADWAKKKLREAMYHNSAVRARFPYKLTQSEYVLDDLLFKVRQQVEQKQHERFSRGDTVRVVGYGHKIERCDHTGKILSMDIAPHVVGLEGTVAEVTESQPNFIQYSLHGIKEKTAWYNPDQLELVKKASQEPDGIHRY